MTAPTRKRKTLAQQLAEAVLLEANPEVAKADHQATLAHVDSQRVITLHQRLHDLEAKVEVDHGQVERVCLPRISEHALILQAHQQQLSRLWDFKAMTFAQRLKWLLFGVFPSKEAK